MCKNSTTIRQRGCFNGAFTPRSSKRPANVFKIHVLIAGRLLDRVNTLQDSMSDALVYRWPEKRHVDWPLLALIL